MIENIVLDKEMYSVREVSDILEEDDFIITNRIKRGVISSIIVSNKFHFIKKEEVQKMFNAKQNIVNNYYDLEEAAELLKITVEKVRGRLKRKKYKDIEKYGIKAYISKLEIDKEVKNQSLIKVKMISISEVMKKIGLSRFKVQHLIDANILKGHIYSGIWYVEEISLDAFIQKIIEGYTIKQAAKILKIDYKLMESLVNSVPRQIESFETKNYGIRITKEEIERFLNRQEYSTVEAASILNTTIAVVAKCVREGTLNATTILKNGTFLIPKKEVIDLSQSLEWIKKKYIHLEDYNGLFKEIIGCLLRTSEYKETISYYSLWAKRKVSESNKMNIKIRVRELLLTIEKLVKVLDKEIFNYTDAEIMLLIEKVNFAKKDLKNFGQFLEYCKKNTECSYKNRYTLSEKTKKEEKDIYSKEQWINYYELLTDVDRHIEAAINEKKYAEIWLFTLLHLNLAWRKDDIRKLPIASLNLVGIDSFEWFREDKNEFTLTMAQKIVNDITRRSIGIKTNKTNVNTHFVIGIVIPTAIAMSICSLHNKNVGKMFSYAGFNSYDYREFFKEEVPPFRSQKANRTYMTYGYETATKVKGRNHLAYRLMSYARSHKSSLYKENNITSVYINTSNTDLSASNMTWHLFERGFFGWQIDMMLNIAYNTSSWSIENTTDAISKIKEEFSPIVVDNMSKYLNRNHEQSVVLFKELLAIPKEHIKEKLSNIADFKSPSLIDFTQCMKSIKQCPYKRSIPCLGCKYMIPTNYVLQLVNTELFTLIDALEKTDDIETTKRIKYTHMIEKLMYILQDFRISYNRFDRNYITSFIDLKELRERFKCLEQTKFIRL